MMLGGVLSEGVSEGPSSLEEVSPSDLAELQAHKSAGSERRRSADTTASAASLQSEHTAGLCSPFLVLMFLLPNRLGKTRLRIKKKDVTTNATMLQEIKKINKKNSSVTRFFSFS